MQLFTNSLAMQDDFPRSIAQCSVISELSPHFPQLTKVGRGQVRSQPLWYLLLAGSSLVLGMNYQGSALANPQEAAQTNSTPTDSLKVGLTIREADRLLGRLPASALPETSTPEFSIQASSLTQTDPDPISTLGSSSTPEVVPAPEMHPTTAMSQPNLEQADPDVRAPFIILSKAISRPELMTEQVADRRFYRQFLVSEVPSNSPDAMIGSSVDLSPAMIQGSPVLQRWLKQVPDVSATIIHSPSFRPRLRVGYNQFPSTGQTGGWNIGVEDIFVGDTPFTISGKYYSAFQEQRQGWGVDLHYYLRPLGSYVNVAPVIGYQNLQTALYNRDGMNVGFRLLVVLSRGGGADFMLTQTWLTPGTDGEIGLTTFSAGYALTSRLRLSADIQQQNARQRQDSRLGIALEWLL